MANIDVLMQKVRSEIDAKERKPQQSALWAEMIPEMAPTTRTAQKPGKKTKLGLLSRIFNIRGLLQRSIGLRETAKLEPYLKRMRQGPLPIPEIPGAIEDMMVRLSALESAAANNQKLVSTVESSLRQMEKIADANLDLSRRIADVEASRQSLEKTAEISELKAKVDGLETVTRELIKTFANVTMKAGESNGLETVNVKLETHWRSISDQNVRLNMLIHEARRRLPAELDVPAFVAIGDQRLDAMYVDFEDRYRGTRADIKDRQTIYLPRIQNAKWESRGEAFLDIGCGRGEFLTLLKENSVEGRGVDANTGMIETCKAQGLDVELNDAFSYLKTCKSNSLIGISGFHIIEHIPFAKLIGLFDEALRVIAPGGLLIFETPNPANLLVAAERFYTDPTHLNPLPDALIGFLTEARGFVEVEILPLHPVQHQKKVYEDPMLSLLQEKLYGPQDYAVLARKARS